MLNYKVKPGDSLSVLAIRYRTTIRLLMEANPSIDFTRSLTVGETINIDTAEDKRSEFIKLPLSQSKKVQSYLKTNHLKDFLFPADQREVKEYKGRNVKEGQIAFLKAISGSKLIDIQGNGLPKKIRDIKPGEIFGVYDHATIRGINYLIVDQYLFVENDETIFDYEEIPLSVREGKIDMRKPIYGADFSKFLPYSLNSFSENETSSPSIGYGPVQEQTVVSLPPVSFVGSGDRPNQNHSNNMIDSGFYSAIDHARPLLVMRAANGDSKRVEMRVLGSSVSYTNAVKPSATNAGWMINVGPTQLPTLNISGFLLETENNQEFISFTDQYRRLLQAQKVDDFYSLGVSTLFYKRSEYQGIIISFTHSEQSEQRFNRRYQLQMIVLKEKSLSKSQTNNISRPIGSGPGTTYSNYRSDIARSLLNVVTGSKDSF